MSGGTRGYRILNRMKFVNQTDSTTALLLPVQAGAELLLVEPNLVPALAQGVAQRAYLISVAVTTVAQEEPQGIFGSADACGIRNECWVTSLGSLRTKGELALGTEPGAALLAEAGGLAAGGTGGLAQAGSSLLIAQGQKAYSVAWRTS
jgi:hypothetical protein